MEYASLRLEIAAVYFDEPDELARHVFVSEIIGRLAKFFYGLTDQDLLHMIRKWPETPRRAHAIDVLSWCGTTEILRETSACHLVDEIVAELSSLTGHERMRLRAQLLCDGGVR